MRVRCIKDGLICNRYLGEDVRRASSGRSSGGGRRRRRKRRNPE
jgi:hypothetical protein